MNNTFCLTAVALLITAQSLTSTFAADTIQFDSNELNALYVLGRPDLAAAGAQGKTGIFVPSPPMKYFGIQEQSFKIDLGFLGAIADVHFNHLNINTPTVHFANSKMLLTVPIADNTSGIKSDLGSIGFQGVSVTAALDWNQSTSAQELQVETLSLQGNITGTGVLSNSFILSQVKKLALQIVKQQIQTVLNSQFQEVIQNGMLQWAKISAGSSGSSIVPGSIQIYSDSNQSGIRYSVD